MAAPNTPTDLTVETVFSNAIYLTWTDGGGGTATSYILYRQDYGVGDYNKVLTIEIEEEGGSPDTEAYDEDVVSTFVDEDGITQSKSYRYKIAASNADGTSALSAATASETTLQKDLNFSQEGYSNKRYYDANAFYRGEDASRKDFRGETLTWSEFLRLHDRQHAIDSSNDHTSTITQGNIIEGDANGLPEDTGIASSDVVATNGVIITTSTVANTTTETTIYTLNITADSLQEGQVFMGRVSGSISNDSASDDITIKIKIGSTVVESFKPAVGNVTDADWHFHGYMTVRSTGASGSVAFHGHVEIDGNVDNTNSLETIDTTVSEDVTVTVTWDNAKAGNTISIYQGFVYTNRLA